MNASTAQRPGAVTFRGTPMTLIGPELHVGEPAPAFSLATKNLQHLTLVEAIDDGARSALLIVVPSLDTNVCALETQTFHKRIAELPPDVAAFVVSMDLPFAQQRWALANNATDGLTFVSDYRERSFGPAYGVLIKELGFLARAIFVIGKDRTLKYVDVMRDIADQPDYDAVLKSAASQ